MGTSVRNGQRGPRALVGAAALTGLLACSPSIDQADCSELLPCPDRGDLCNTEEGICTPNEVDLESTEDPAPPSFNGKAISFFRGRVCLPHEVKAGEAFPVSLDPCLHPCIQREGHRFRQSWSCEGSSCEAWALVWVTGSSSGQCPTDAFGRFDPSQCVYGEPIELKIDPVYEDGTPIEGTMLLDIPFLKNADAEEIERSNGDQAVIEAAIQKYPRQDERIPGGKPISMAEAHPAPPSTCAGGQCDCFEVGF